MKMGEVGLKRKRSSFRVSSNYLGQGFFREMNSRQVRRRLGAGSTGLGLLAMRLGVQTESRWSSEHKDRRTPARILVSRGKRSSR